MSHFELFESYIPVNLLNPYNALMAALLVYAVILFRYFLMVTPFWLWFYRWRGGLGFAQQSQKASSKDRVGEPSQQPTLSKQIYPELPSSQSQWFEIKWSVATSVIFALAGVLMGVLWQEGYTQIYLKFDEYGWGYFFLSPILLAVVHDAYFYWTHRWLHLPKVYKKYHAIHHASLRPSPWASFSFHPVESIINALAIPLIILFLPLHPVILLFHLTLMTITAILNHLGFETLPRGRWGLWLSKHWVSGLHHAQHHRYFNYNFGLFFTWWDRWLGTEHRSFDQEIQKFLAPSEQ